MKSLRNRGSKQKDKAGYPCFLRKSCTTLEKIFRTDHLFKIYHTASNEARCVVTML